MEQNEIKALIEAYKALLETKDDLAAQTKENNQAVIEARDALANAMLEAEIPAIEYAGFTWRLKPTTKYSKKAGADEELFEFLRENGLGDIIKETVNAQTLQGTMSELAEENDSELPEGWEEVINKYEFNDVSKRKAK